MGELSARRAAGLAGQPADRQPDLPDLPLPHDRLVGRAAVHALQRRVPAADGRQAPRAHAAGRAGLGRDLADGRPDARFRAAHRAGHLVGGPAAADGPARLLGGDLLDLLLQPAARRRRDRARGVHGGEGDHRGGGRPAPARRASGARRPSRAGAQRGRGVRPGRPGPRAGPGGGPVRRRLPARTWRRRGGGQEQRAGRGTVPGAGRARRLAGGGGPAHRPAGHAHRRDRPVRAASGRRLGEGAGRGDGAAADRGSRRGARRRDRAGRQRRPGPGRRLPVVPGPGGPADRGAGERCAGLPGPAAPGRGAGRARPGQDDVLLQRQPRVPHAAHPDHGPGRGAADPAGPGRHAPRPRNWT